MNEHENNIRDLLSRIRFDDIPSPRHRDALEQRVVAALSQASRPSSARTEIRRTTMKRRLTPLVAAAIVAIGTTLGVFIFHDKAAPAYAVGQTIKAMKSIQTIHMKGEFYRQGEFECWMQFDGDPDRPTHVWLGRSGENLCKICSPVGVFGLNIRTNRVHFASRDERGKSWIPKFGSFFKEVVRQARTDDTIRVEEGEDAITVRVIMPQREQEFLVDPQSKLPMRFTTIRDDNPMEMMMRTLAVKHLTEIHYDEEPPAGIFDKPSDAVVVEEEVDCLVDPDSGLIADDMTPEEACTAIVRQTGQALVDVDQATLCKLDLFYRLYPPPIWEQIRKMKDAGQWVSEVVITGAPYREGDSWYVPTEVRNETKPAEVTTPMIRFYQLEGKTLCFIIGSKEKGIVD